MERKEVIKANLHGLAECQDSFMQRAKNGTETIKFRDGVVN